MKYRSHVLVVFVSMALPLASSAQCSQGNLIINGSLSGPEGEGLTPPDWIGGVTPDTNDDNGPLNTTPGYIWSGVPVASSDGGTWVNLFGLETVAQQVPLTVGVDYVLEFEYAAHGIFFDSTFFFIGPTAPVVKFDGITVYSPPLDNTQFTWEQASYNFTASSSSVQLLFSESTGTMYLGIDGVCIHVSDPFGVQDLFMGQRPAVLPNPVNDIARINVRQRPDLTWRVVSASGADVPVDARWDAQGLVFDMGRLVEGVYHLQLFWSDGTHALPVVVKH